MNTEVIASFYITEETLADRLEHALKFAMSVYCGFICCNAETYMMIHEYCSEKEAQTSNGFLTELFGMKLTGVQVLIHSYLETGMLEVIRIRE